MSACSEIKRRIDEADDCESYDLDVARHTERCGDCRRFAGERAALRELLGSTARVAAPVNFDAVLHARLAEVKARRGLAWLNAAFYLRAGAATAALAVMVFTAQHLGLFARSVAEQPTPQSPEIQANVVTSTSPVQTPPVSPTPDNHVAGNEGSRPHVVAIPANTYASNRARAASAAARRGAGVPLVSPVDAAFVDGGAILIPGRNGQRDVTVPAVSVGAQPLIYGNAGRQPQPTRPITVSF
jgi:hypothetical protein